MNQMRLSDKDALADCLSTAKHISSAYHHAMLESANQKIWDTLAHCHNEELYSCRMLFQTMNSQGWYQVQPATTSTGAQTAQGMYSNPGQFSPQGTQSPKSQYGFGTQPGSMY